MGSSDLTTVQQWLRTELLLRATAVASASEAEFVRRLRDKGVAICPQSRSAGDAVSSYAVEAIVGSGRWRADVEIGAGLALPILRGDWDRSARAEARAAAQWRGVGPSTPFDRHRITLSGPVVWQRMIADANRFHQWLRQPAPSVETCGWAAARVAGAVAAWALRIEPESGGPLSDAVAAAAEAAAVGEIPAAPPSRLSGVAFGLSQLDDVDETRAPEAPLLCAYLVVAAFEVSKHFHRHGDSFRAEAMDRVTVALDSFCTSLQDHIRSPRTPEQ